MGKLYVNFATMEAGKSAQLLMEAYNFEKRGIGFLCMKPSIDNRESNEKITSRIGIERECLTIYPEYDLYKIVNEIHKQEGQNKLLWILVDESQFLTTKQVEQLRYIVDDLDVNVICYGIRTDFKTHLFEGSKRLVELSDDINELKISCECGRKAIFNARFNDMGELVTSGKQILIGGSDIYKPMCSKCYRKAISKVSETSSFENNENF